MIKRKMSILLSSFVAVGALVSLTGCKKKYDLVIYSWEDYIYEGTDDDGNPIDDEGGVIDRFIAYYQEKHGKTLKVDYETFSTNEDMYQQLSLGAIKPDVICPSDYMIQKMANEGLLEKFSYDETSGLYGESLQNFEDYGSPFIKGRFENEKLSDGNSFLSYAVPYFWGTMGFTYNPDFFDEEEVNTWECLWTKGEITEEFPNGKNFKQFSLKDSMRDTYVTAIFHVFKNEIAALDESAADYNAQLSAIFNDCRDETIAKVKTALIDAKKNLSTVYGLEVDEGKNDIVTGKYNANLAWSGDAIYAMDSAEDADKTLNYALPKEGSNVWFDGWCMPKGARKDVAEEFVNFMCDPEIAVLCMDEVGYTSPIVGDAMWEYVQEKYAAKEDATDTYEVDLGFYFGKASKINIPTSEKGRQFDAQYPTEEALRRCCIMKDFGDQQEKVDKMWSEFKAA